MGVNIHNLYHGKMSCCSASCYKITLSVNIFSTKVLFENTVFTSLTGDSTAISSWSSEPREGLNHLQIS